MKRQRQNTWLIILGVAMVAGYGYSLDMPQALQTFIRQPPFSFDSVQMNMLYFAMFIPVLCLDLVVGMAIDRVPLYWSVLALTSVSFISQFATTLLFYYTPTYYKMGLYVFRAFFGLAGSTAFTVQSLLIAKYSNNYDLAFGAGLCIPFIGDSINLYFTPYLVDTYQSAVLPWIIATSVDLLSLAMAVGIAIILIKKKKRGEHQHHQEIQNQAQSNRSIRKVIQPSQQSINPIIDSKNQSIISINSQNLNQQKPQRQNATQKEQIISDHFSWEYFKKLPRLFWLIVLNVVFSEFVIGGIFSNLNDLMVKRFTIPYVTAGQISMISYICAALFSVIFGLLISKNSMWRRRLIFVAPVLMSVGLICVYFLPNTQNATALYYIVVVGLNMSIGAGFATLYAVLDNSVVLLVDQNKLGSVWGIVGTAIAAGEVVGPLVNGFILDSGEQLNSAYSTVTLMYAIVSLIAVAFAASIFFGPHHILDSNFQKSQDEVRQQLIPPKSLNSQ